MYHVNIEQNEIKTSIKGHNGYKFEKLAGNNPNIAVVNVNVYINIWCNYPHAFFKKNERDIVIASVRPSVCPLCYLILNH